jgi:hypothetical protein
MTREEYVSKHGCGGADAFEAGYRAGWHFAREKAAKIALERTGCKNNCCMRLACVVARNIAGKISRMVHV